MKPTVRKYVTYEEEVLIESSKVVAEPWRLFAVAASSYLSFADTRGPANAAIVVPLMDKHDAGKRSHYLTVQFAIPDAPRDDEIVVASGGATGGRPHHRIGDRYQDLKELGHALDNPAAL